MIGQTINNYTVRDYLSSGGFSHVYLASSPGGEDVIIKKGRETGGDGSGTVPFNAKPCHSFDMRSSPFNISLDKNNIDQILELEGRLLSRMGGQGFPKLLALAQSDDNRPLLIMEKATGTSLRDSLSDKQSLSPNILLQIIDRLIKTQKTGYFFYHGDLKPEHVFLFENKVTLIDPSPQLPLHKMPPPDPTALYTMGFQLATPPYNPFLVQGEGADRLALAIMGYEIITGSLPFKTDTLPQPIWAFTDPAYGYDQLFKEYIPLMENGTAENQALFNFIDQTIQEEGKRGWHPDGPPLMPTADLLTTFRGHLSKALGG